MRRFTPLLLSGLLTGLAGLWGCPRKAPPEGQTNQAGGSGQASEACATDKDCVLTCDRLKHCCLGCTHPYAVHRSRAAAIERWHRLNCKPGTYHCPKVKCSRPKGDRRARCKKRRCVTEVSLGQPRVMSKR